jgi:hypothetical protein
VAACGLVSDAVWAISAEEGSVARANLVDTMFGGWGGKFHFVFVTNTEHSLSDVGATSYAGAVGGASSHAGAVAMELLAVQYVLECGGADAGAVAMENARAVGGAGAACGAISYAVSGPLDSAVAPLGSECMHAYLVSDAVALAVAVDNEFAAGGASSHAVAAVSYALLDVVNANVVGEVSYAGAGAMENLAAYGAGTAILVGVESANDALAVGGENAVGSCYLVDSVGSCYLVDVGGACSVVPSLCTVVESGASGVLAVGAENVDEQPLGVPAEPG